MPCYDFKCVECGEVQEVSIKLADYDKAKNEITCTKCHSKMKRMMDYKGGFTLKGAGWFGANGSGTGYEVTQNELDKNGDDNKFLEEKMR